MKAQHWLIALIVFFTCSTVVSANDVFDNLTQDDGLAAIKAGDDLGFEVLSRAELESVRGEAIAPIIVGGMLITMAMFYYKWVTDPEWVMNNPTAVRYFNETRS